MPMAIKGRKVVPGWTRPAMFRAMGPTAAAAGPSAIRLVSTAVRPFEVAIRGIPASIPSGARASITDLAIQYAAPVLSKVLPNMMAPA